jgi:hypothetical protein
MVWKAWRLTSATSLASTIIRFEQHWTIQFRRLQWGIDSHLQHL